MRKQILHKALYILLGLACLGLVVFTSKTAEAANPATISFQGKIVNSADGTNITSPNGTYSIIFRIYNTASPTMTTACNTTSSCLWQETEASVQLTNGIFQVELGSACALTSASCNNSAGGPINFSSSNSLYLTMQFNGDTSGANGGFMSPLIHMNSVPFALQSDNSSLLGGLASSAFAQLAQAVAFTNSVSIQPASNVAALTVKQNGNGSPTADIADIQTQNGTAVITVTGPALNEAAVTITSVGATRDLTLGSASGIIKLTSATTTLQKSAAALTLDISNAGASTLTVSNSNGSNVANLSVTGDIAAGSGHVFKVGTTSGVAQSACTGGQFSQGAAATGGIITTAGTCGYAVNAIGTFGQTTSYANGFTISNATLTLGAATGSNPGVVNTQGQTFSGDKIFTGSVQVQSASGAILGTSSSAGLLSIYDGGNHIVTIKTATSSAAYSIILPASAGGINQCLMNTGTPGTLTWGVCGGGVSTIKQTFVPEFAGAVLTGDGSSNAGTMTSDFCSGSSVGPAVSPTPNPCGASDQHNYYAWTANATNDYDVWFRWQVPSDYSALATSPAVSFYGWRNSGSDAVTLNIYAQGSASACGSASVASNAAWASTNVTTSGCSFTAGSIVLFDAHLSVGVNGEYARVGEITLSYVRQ